MPDISLGPVPHGSSRLRGYLARPSGPGPWPGVVVVHEAFGLDEVLRRQCDRLAAAGYLALAPDLFSDGGARRCLARTMQALHTRRGRAFADIEASRRHLLESADCTGRVGIVGFCMGGGFALVAATRGFDVAAANYGIVPSHAESSLAGACPVVASYGGRDRVLPPGQPAKLDRALTRAGVEHDLKVYPAAGHSFLNDAPNGPGLLRPFLRVLNVGPNPEAAADGWARIEAFLAHHLTDRDTERDAEQDT